jgi:molybdopterin-guanine dinucleotide biosynthesis protein A
VPPDLLRELMQRAASYDAVVPESGSESKIEPLCAVYGTKCLPHIRNQFVDEDFRAQGFLDSVRVGRIPYGDLERFGDPSVMFFNVNTPDDLKQAQEHWKQLGR